VQTILEIYAKTKNKQNDKTSSKANDRQAGQRERETKIDLRAEIPRQDLVINHS